MLFQQPYPISWSLLCQFNIRYRVPSVTSMKVNKRTIAMIPVVNFILNSFFILWKYWQWIWLLKVTNYYNSVKEQENHAHKTENLLWHIASFGISWRKFAYMVWQGSLKTERDRYLFTFKISCADFCKIKFCRKTFV